MKVMAKTMASAALIAAAIMASGTALAHRTSVGIGIGFGFPGYWYAPGPYPYYPPAYPYYDPYYDPAVPTTYVEQAAPPLPAQQEGQWWYYCDQAQAYYPYVRECAGGWRKVAPTPPGG